MRDPFVIAVHVVVGLILLAIVAPASIVVLSGTGPLPVIIALFSLIMMMVGLCTEFVPLAAGAFLVVLCGAGRGLVVIIGALWTLALQ